MVIRKRFLKKCNFTIKNSFAFTWIVGTFPSGFSSTNQGGLNFTSTLTFSYLSLSKYYIYIRMDSKLQSFLKFYKKLTEFFWHPTAKLFFERMDNISYWIRLIYFCRFWELGLLAPDVEAILALQPPFEKLSELIALCSIL